MKRRARRTGRSSLSTLLALTVCFCSSTAIADVAGADPDARLAKAWRQLHPHAIEPAQCRHPDPVRAFSGDVDPAPGIESALGSLRFGVVLFDAAGHPLAAYQLGCGAPAYTDEERAQSSRLLDFSTVRASGLAPNDLVARRRIVARCGRFDYWEPLRRAGATLRAMASIEESADGECGTSPSLRYQARIEVRAIGELLVEHEGTLRPWLPGGDHGPPERYHDHQFLHLTDGEFK